MKNWKLLLVVLAVLSLICGANAFACGGSNAVVKVVKATEKGVDCGGCGGCKGDKTVKEGGCGDCGKGDVKTDDGGGCGTMKVKPLADLAKRSDWGCCVDSAIAQAKKENKLVLVDFTYLSDCPFCQAMNDKVFTNEKFLSAVKDKFVLCLQDNCMKSPVEKVTEAQKKYSTPLGLVAIDNDGTPLCSVNWFTCDNDVSKVLDAINSSVKDGVAKRDENNELAGKIENAKGEDRAKLGIQVIENAGAFFKFYQKSIDLALQADLDNNTGIQGKYGVACLQASGFPTPANAKELINQSDKLLSTKNLDADSKNVANATKVWSLYYLGQKAEALKALENCNDMKSFWGQAFSKDKVKKILSACEECPGCEECPSGK